MRWLPRVLLGVGACETELSELTFPLLLGPVRVRHELKHPRFTLYPAVFGIFFPMGQLFRGLHGIILLDGLALDKKFIFPDTIASWCEVIFFLIFPNSQKKFFFFFLNPILQVSSICLFSLNCQE